jgi:hypothetical protein
MFDSQIGVEVWAYINHGGNLIPPFFMWLE